MEELILRLVFEIRNHILERRLEILQFFILTKKVILYFRDRYRSRFHMIWSKRSRVSACSKWRILSFHPLTILIRWTFTCMWDCITLWMLLRREKSLASTSFFRTHTLRPIRLNSWGTITSIWLLNIWELWSRVVNFRFWVVRWEVVMR